MKSTLIWLIFAGAIVLFGDSVDAWNRQIFNRYSRNLFRNGDVTATGHNNDIDDFNTVFGLGNEFSGLGVGAEGGTLGIGNNLNGIGEQQQTEVYGIVEPLIEDTPCVDRPCQANDDCCPTGVCVNTYGEGKCIYVYGRKRDLCHRHLDCEAGMSCIKSVAGNLVCQPIAVAAAAHPVFRMMGIGGNVDGSDIKNFNIKLFGEDCATSSDCNVAKGMCCQLQRTHHNRILPKKMCAYFRDPFTCIDIMPTAEEEGVRESRFLSSFNQRRI